MMSGTCWHTGAVSELPALAEFLRSRRERLSPERAGLTPNRRRRTPGLRREEVATLAGVSIDYLVRLEQGRDTNPSDDVLLALAGALQLSRDETRHLMALRRVGTTPQMEQLCPTVPDLDARVSPTAQTVLDRLDPAPAHVVGPAGDVVASNAAWRTVVEPLGLSDGSNLPRHVFEHPDVYADWPAIADAEVVRLRGAQLFHGDDDRFAGLIDDLLELPEFAVRWNGQPVAGDGRGRLGLRHPDVGELSLEFESMALATDDQRLVCWLPADAAAAAALDRLTIGLAMSPAQLRVVGDA